MKTLKNILFGITILSSLNSFSQNPPVKIKEKSILQISETPTAEPKYYFKIQTNQDPEEPELIYYKFLKYEGITNKIKDKSEIIKYKIDLDDDGEIDVKGYYRYTYPLSGKKIQVIFQDKLKSNKWEIHYTEQTYNKKGYIIQEREAFDFNGDKIIDLIKYYNYNYNYKNRTRTTTIKIDDKADGIIDDEQTLIEKI